jgi:hypothetical protein
VAQILASDRHTSVTAPEIQRREPTNHAQPQPRQHTQVPTNATPPTARLPLTATDQSRRRPSEMPTPPRLPRLTAVTRVEQ